MYLTTNTSAGTGGVFLQPTDVNGTYSLHLTVPLVIAGKAKSKFIVDAISKVGSDFVNCGMNPPVFGLQKVQYPAGRGAGFAGESFPQRSNNPAGRGNGRARPKPVSCIELPGQRQGSGGVV